MRDWALVLVFAFLCGLIRCATCADKTVKDVVGCPEAEVLRVAAKLNLRSLNRIQAMH